MSVKIEATWKEKLQAEFTKPYFTDLQKFVKSEYTKNTIYPPGSQIFNAYDKCPFDKVRVVIVGQDPYHGAGQANGLAFSVNDGVQKPPSLVNIFKEIEADLGTQIPESGNLERWAKQGVLLLNTTLTVREKEPASHKGQGWEEFTDSTIRTISSEKEGVVFLLWGKHAESKKEIIDTDKHFILTAAHPSPFSAYQGFFGCKHFSQTNKYLIIRGEEPIAW